MENTNPVITQLKPQFDKYSWTMNRNGNTFSFLKNTKEFRIDIDESFINVFVPLKESCDLYKTSFKDYFNAFEYVNMHLDYHEA